jgi:hypothetical protein
VWVNDILLLPKMFELVNWSKLVHARCVRTGVQPRARRDSSTISLTGFLGGV